MRRFLLFLALFLWMFLPVNVSAQEGDTSPTPAETSENERSTPQPVLPSIGINYPAANETVKGLIPITGTVSLSGFSLWELSFSFSENTTGTWFLLQSGSEPISGELTVWDTTSLTDGDYALRLRVYLSDGYQDVLVAPVRVRNYKLDTATPTVSPSATGTLLPTATATPLAPTPTLSPTPRPRPSQLPPNPATLNNTQIFNAIMRGAGYAVLFFAFFGSLLYWQYSKSK